MRFLISDQAIASIKNSLKAKDIEKYPKAGLRISFSKFSVFYTNFDTVQKPDDLIIDQSGVKIYISEKEAEKINKTKLDCEEIFGDSCFILRSIDDI